MDTSPDNGAGTPPGNRRFILLTVIALALVAGFWGLRTWRYDRVHESTDDAQIDGDIIPVLARVGGYVTEVTVDENQHMQGGQLLVTIDDAQYRVALAQ